MADPRLSRALVMLFVSCLSGLVGATFSAASERLDLNGTLFASAADEFIVKRNWIPAEDCHPVCSVNNTCCKDPSSGQTSGICFDTGNCSQVQDTNVTLKLKLLRLDVVSGQTIKSQGLPMAPHSGASLPNVALPSGDVLMHAIFIVDNEEVTALLRWSLGNISIPPRLVGQCTLDARLAALFALGKDVYGVPFAMANRLVKVIPPALRHNDAGNISMDNIENDIKFINAIREARPCEQSPLLSELPAPVYINQTEPIPGGGNISLSNPAQYAVVGTTFYYANQINNSILGITLPEVQIQANIQMHMALQYDSMSPGGGKTLLIGNTARSLLKLDLSHPDAPVTILNFPNASGGMWTATPSGYVIYQARLGERLGWVVADPEGRVLVESPPISGLCLKPAYSCWMDYMVFVPNVF